MSFRDALRVKSAEFWLMLGQPESALLELQKLPAEAQSDPWVSGVSQNAWRAVRGLPDNPARRQLV